MARRYGALPLCCGRGRHGGHEFGGSSGHGEHEEESATAAAAGGRHSDGKGGRLNDAVVLGLFFLF
jgi:hypothetical protein